MIEIFQYTQYREYLRDYYRMKKTSGKNFSFQVFAKKAGIGSKGFLLHVMKGERNLTKPVLQKIARAMGLDDVRIEYFEDLVSFDQAKSQTERDFYYGKIMALRRTVQVKSLDDSQYEFFSAWHHSVVRELVALMPAETPPPVLARAVVPGITAAQVKRSLQLLEELGILKRNPLGGYSQSQPFIGGSGAPVRKIAITKFQQAMMGIASQAWDHFRENEIFMGTVTFTMSEALMRRATAEMRAFRDRMLDLVQNDPEPANRVYHLNLHLFPVSKRVGETQ